jgi:hypothetical protein
MSPMYCVLVNIRRVVFDSIYLLNFEITQLYGQYKYKVYHTAVQWLALLHVWEGLGKSPGDKTSSPDRRFLRVSSVTPRECDVLQTLPDNAILSYAILVKQFLNE